MENYPALSIEIKSKFEPIVDNIFGDKGTYIFTTYPAKDSEIISVTICLQCDVSLYKVTKFREKLGYDLCIYPDIIISGAENRVFLTLKLDGTDIYNVISSP